MNTFALHAGSSRATACAVVTDVGKRNSQSAVSSRRIASQGPDFVVTTTSGGSVDVPVAFLTYEDALLIESSRWSQVLNKLEQKGVPEDISAKSRDAWGCIDKYFSLKSRKAPPPIATFLGDRLQFAWNRTKACLDVDIYPDGFCWFYLNHDTGESDGVRIEGELVRDLPEEFLRHLFNLEP